MTHIASVTKEPREHDDVEITDEMIEAGVEAFLYHDSRLEDTSDAVFRVVTAVLATGSRHFRDCRKSHVCGLPEYKEFMR